MPLWHAQISGDDTRTSIVRVRGNSVISTQRETRAFRFEAKPWVWTSSNVSSASPTMGTLTHTTLVTFDDPPIARRFVVDIVDVEGQEPRKTRSHPINRNGVKQTGQWEYLCLFGRDMMLCRFAIRISSLVSKNWQLKYHCKFVHYFNFPLLRVPNVWEVVSSKRVKNWKFSIVKKTFTLCSIFPQHQI